MTELPEDTIAPRELQPGQRCEVWIASVTGERELAFPNVDVLLEAPNWTRDSAALLLNGAGNLWPFAGHAQLARVRADGSGLERLTSRRRTPPECKFRRLLTWDSERSDAELIRYCLPLGAALRIEQVQEHSPSSCDPAER
ncbi:hypothetical protein [Arthrobacter sp. NicSoilC12]|uniref:hypothetical protein n=1 Tax=Arthrobacter sp. NicSoilC12 TaxID=2831001 RepID=UPI001CC52855|nr:hypothetical protein [Arthrobacter sp. NicSoilC12]GIU55759.1 hypothetical protein NicSoilC12_15080 [Arthrobacter sp. NicSoilC12]